MMLSQNPIYHPVICPDEHPSNSRGPMQLFSFKLNSSYLKEPFLHFFHFSSLVADLLPDEDG